MSDSFGKAVLTTGVIFAVIFAVGLTLEFFTPENTGANHYTVEVILPSGEVYETTN